MKYISIILMLPFISNLNAQLIIDPNFNNFHRQTELVPGYGQKADYFYVPFVDKTFLGGLSQLWLGGFNEEGDLHLAAETYRGSASGDFTFGPLDQETGEPFSNTENFNRVWIVKGKELQDLKLKFLSDILSVADIPKDILEWPAIGNPFFSPAENEELQQELAPFFDHDSDGRYNPLLGDLPILQNLTFQSLSEVWSPFIFSFQVGNDVIPHQTSRGDIINVEVRQMNYLMNCNSSPDLNNTLFSNFVLINRSSSEYTDFKIGLWDDPNMHAAVGCYPALNTQFAYLDEKYEGTLFEDFPGTSYGYTRNLILLNHDMNSSMAYANASVGIPNPLMVDPASPQDYYNYLNAKWRDGTGIAPYGNGYDAEGVEFTKFLYPQLPNNVDGWSMATNSEHLPNDFRTIFSVDALGEEDVFEKGEMIAINIASFIMLDSENPGLAIFDDWENRIQNLISKYNQMVSDPASNFDCFNLLSSSGNVQLNQNHVIKIFPNPASDELFIELEQNVNATAELMDLFGRSVGRKIILNQNTSLDISHLTSGFYYLKIKLEKGGIQIMKLNKL